MEAGERGTTGVRTFRAGMEGLLVHAQCGVTREERALPQTLRVDLDYSYEVETGDDLLGGTVDYGALVEGVAELLEGEEFKLLETGVSRVGEYVMSRFPAVREVHVTLTKLRVPVARALAGASVASSFRR